MQEKIKSPAGAQENKEEKSKAELLNEFNGLGDTEIAYSPIVGELFCFDRDGEGEVSQRIGKIKKDFAKDAALFRVAKLYYEKKQDIASALKTASEINDPDERTRCLVHLATAVLNNDGNLDLADKITKQITEDNHGYMRYYEKARREYIESRSIR